MVDRNNDIRDYVQRAIVDAVAWARDNGDLVTSPAVLRLLVAQRLRYRALKSPDLASALLAEARDIEGMAPVRDTAA